MANKEEAGYDYYIMLAMKEGNISEPVFLMTTTMAHILAQVGVSVKRDNDEPAIPNLGRLG